MPYTVTPTAIAEVLVLTPKVLGDARGFFLESFNAREFAESTGLNVAFVQDNHSKSGHGVLRGLHYQIQHPQGKLVRVVQGEVFDVAVDMRRSSATFGQWVGERLSADNHKQLWVPPGFAHGFVVLSETAEFLYKTTDYWYPEHERSLLWSDTTVGIAWPIDFEPKLAAKDAGAKGLIDADKFERSPKRLGPVGPRCGHLMMSARTEVRVLKRAPAYRVEAASSHACAACDQAASDLDDALLCADTIDAHALGVSEQDT